MNLDESYTLVDTATSAFLSEFRKQCFAPMAEIYKMILYLKLPKWVDRSIKKLYRVNRALFFSPGNRAYALTSKYRHDTDQIRLCVVSTAREVYGLG